MPLESPIDATWIKPPALTGLPPAMATRLMHPGDGFLTISPRKWFAQKLLQANQTARMRYRRAANGRRNFSARSNKKAEALGPPPFFIQQG